MRCRLVRHVARDRDALRDCRDSPIEARFRTWDESDGIALRSDAALAFTLIIR